MAVYVISDIHGEYGKFIKLLDMIDLKDEDTLYILGDVVDRGPHPVKVLLKLMEMPNAVCMVGNHELMAIECLEFMMKDITDSSINELDSNILGNITTWQRNGSQTTINEFRKLDRSTQADVIEFMKEFKKSGEDLPLCSCGGLIKPDVVLYEGKKMILSIIYARMVDILIRRK